MSQRLIGGMQTGTSSAQKIQPRESSKTNITCKLCKSPVPKEWKFCTQCGSQLASKLPDSSSYIPISDKKNKGFQHAQKLYLTPQSRPKLPSAAGEVKTKQQPVRSTRKIQAPRDSVSTVGSLKAFNKFGSRAHFGGGGSKVIGLDSPSSSGLSDFKTQVSFTVNGQDAGRPFSSGGVAKNQASFTVNGEDIGRPMSPGGLEKLQAYEDMMDDPAEEATLATFASTSRSLRALAAEGDAGGGGGNGGQRPRRGHPPPRQGSPGGASRIALPARPHTSGGLPGFSLGGGREVGASASVARAMRGTARRAPGGGWSVGGGGGGGRPGTVGGHERGRRRPATAAMSRSWHPNMSLRGADINGSIDQSFPDIFGNQELAKSLFDETAKLAATQKRHARQEWLLVLLEARNAMSREVAYNRVVQGLAGGAVAAAAANGRPATALAGGAADRRRPPAAAAAPPRPATSAGPAAAAAGVVGERGRGGLGAAPPAGRSTPAAGTADPSASAWFWGKDGAAAAATPAGGRDRAAGKPEPDAGGGAGGGGGGEEGGRRRRDAEEGGGEGGAAAGEEREEGEEGGEGHAPAGPPAAFGAFWGSAEMASLYRAAAAAEEEEEEDGSAEGNGEEGEEDQDAGGTDAGVRRSAAAAAANVLVLDRCPVAEKKKKKSLGERMEEEEGDGKRSEKEAPGAPRFAPVGKPKRPKTLPGALEDHKRLLGKLEKELGIKEVPVEQEWRIPTVERMAALKVRAAVAVAAARAAAARDRAALDAATDAQHDEASLAAGVLRLEDGTLLGLRQEQLARELEKANNFLDRLVELEANMMEEIELHTEKIAREGEPPSRDPWETDSGDEEGDGGGPGAADALEARARRASAAVHARRREMARELRRLQKKRAAFVLQRWARAQLGNLYRPARPKVYIRFMWNEPATAVQSAFRGHLVRRQIQQEKEEKACLQIQCTARGYLGREKAKARWGAAVRLQAAARGRLARRAVLSHAAEVYQKVWDPSTEAFYYHNKQTDEVSWEKPKILSAHDLEDFEGANSTQQNIDNLLSDAENISHSSNSKVANRGGDLNQGNQSYTPLPTGKEEKSWFWGSRAAVEAASHDQEPGSEEQHHKGTKTEEDAAITLQKLLRRRLAQRRMQIAAEAVYEKLFDPASGCHYYHNAAAGTTSWEKPTFLGALDLGDSSS